MFSELWTVRTVTRLAPIRKSDTTVGAPIISTVVEAARHPFDRLLLQDFREKSSVHGLTLSVVASLSVNWHAVDHKHMFLQWSMHEGNTILLVLVRCYFLRLLLVPIDLISHDTISPDLANAVVHSGSEKPNAAQFGLTGVQLNGHIVIEPMTECFSSHWGDVLVIWVGVESIDLHDCFHLVVTHSSFVIVVPRYKTPWDVVVVHHAEELFEVMSPEKFFFFRLIVHLAGDQVTSDGHKIRVFFVDDHLNHVHSLLIALKALSKMQIRELHDFKLVVHVGLQMHAACVVFVIRLVRSL